MERRKFAISATAFITTLFVGRTTKLNGQITAAAAKKTIDGVDSFTGEKTTFTKVTDIKDSECDGVIYRKVGNEYFKRDFTGDIDVRWFGAKGDGVTDDTDAFNKALATPDKKTIYVPSTKNGYIINSTVTIPNNKNLVGDGKGNGENTRTKITFTGTGVLFNVHSYYVTIKDLHIISSANNSVDNTAFFLMVTQTMMENVTIDGFRLGVKNTFGHTTFSHFFRNVMITGCGTGVYFDTANNISFEGCFFDSNNLCAKLNACTQVSFSNGTVMQTSGNLKAGYRRAESSESKILELSNSRAISIRDCYFEVGAGTITGNNQKIATLTSISGFNFTGNYCICSYRPDQPPLFDIADDKCLSVNITGNAFLRTGPNTFIVGTSGTGVGKQYIVNINSNRLSANSFEIDNSFMPQLKAPSKDSYTINYSTQVGYCSLDNGNVHVFGTIILANKDTSLKGPLSIGNLPLAMKKGLNPKLNLSGSLEIKNMTNSKNGKYIDIRSGDSFVQLKDENSNPILFEDIANGAVINFSINYPYAQTTVSGA
jgi:hypothetical protein